MMCDYFCFSVVYWYMFWGMGVDLFGVGIMYWFWEVVVDNVDNVVN